MTTRRVHNVATGQIEDIPVTDDYLRSLKPQILITIANTQKTVDETETISLQLVTRPLLDGTQEPIAQAIDVKMQFGDMVATITLDSNGQWSQDVPLDAPGSFVIKALSHGSNEVTMEVT